MSFEEEFDKIIRQKAEDTKYPFDEGAWLKVSSMLDGERKVMVGAGIKKAIVPVAALLTIGAVGFLAYTFLGHEETSMLPKTEFISRVEEPAVENLPVKTEEKVATASETQNTNTQNTVKSKTESIKAEVKTISKAAIEKVTLSPPVTAKREGPVSENPKVEDKQVVQKHDSPSQTVEQEPAPSENGIAANFNAAKEDQRVVAAAVPIIQSENNKEVAVKKQQDNLEAQPLVTNNSVIAEELFPISALLPVNQTEQDLKEGYQYPIVKDDDYYNQGKLAKKHYLNIEGGGVYLFGWDQSKIKDGKGFNYYGGLNYGRYISRKFSVSLGLQIYNVSNIVKPFYEVTNKEYGFGSTSMYTVVTTNNMLFAAIPVKFNYALNNRNTIALGMNFGYLVAANSYVETYYMRDNEKIYSGTSQSNQIFEGTRSLNMMLTAGYTMHLSNRIAIKGEYLFGLTDLFKNTATITGAEKTSGLRFGVQYTLFDK